MHPILFNEQVCRIAANGLMHQCLVFNISSLLSTVSRCLITKTPVFIVKVETIRAFLHEFLNELVLQIAACFLFLRSLHFLFLKVRVSLLREIRKSIFPSILLFWMIF